MSSYWSEVVTVLAWTKQNTMQRAMRTVLEWPQSHVTNKHDHIMITIKYEPQQKHRLGTVSKNYCGGGGGLNRFYGIPTWNGSKHIVVRSVVRWDCPHRWSIRVYLSIYTASPSLLSIMRKAASGGGKPGHTRLPGKNDPAPPLHGILQT